MSKRFLKALIASLGIVAILTALMLSFNYHNGSMFTITAVLFFPIYIFFILRLFTQLNIAIRFASAIIIAAFILTICLESIFAPYLFVVILFLFLGMFIFALRYLFLNIKNSVVRALLPLIITSAVASLWIATLFDGAISASAAFFWNSRGYNAVINLVRTGELQADNNSHIKLPKEYQYLSGFDPIVKHKNSDWEILFLEDRMGHGYLFNTNESPCRKVLFSRNWYFCFPPSW